MKSSDEMQSSGVGSKKGKRDGKYIKIKKDDRREGGLIGA